MIIARPIRVTRRLVYWPLREWMAVFLYTGESPARYWLSSIDLEPVHLERAQVPAMLRSLEVDNDRVIIMADR